MNNRQKEILGILLVVIAIFLTLSFATYDPSESPRGLSPSIAKSNIMGVFGIYAAYYIMKFTLGWSSFIYPIILSLLGFAIFTRKELEKYFRTSLYLFGLAICSSTIVAAIGIANQQGWSAEYSGSIGYILTNFITDIFGLYAFWILESILLIIIISGLFGFSIYELWISVKDNIQLKWTNWRERKRIEYVIKPAVEFTPIVEEEVTDIPPDEFESINEEEPVEPSEIDSPVTDENGLNIEKSFESKHEDSEGNGIHIEDEIKISEGDLDAQKERKARFKQFKLPSTELLAEPVEIHRAQSADELTQKADQLVHALQTFGVEGRVTRISPGPVITLFEIEPAEGVRVNKFINLSDDLARVMQAQRIRVIAPIPGTRAVGIELPNDEPAMVYLKSIINSQEFVNSKSKLTIGVGKTTIGDAYVFDLSKMPHLLVAGATGAGKSVCINTIIVSILYKAKPDEVKFIMMDPKKLELATYKSLVGYHLITAPNIDEYVMTTAENSVAILDSAITEMERRFQVFSDARVRNIGEYHNRCKTDPGLEAIPYVVVLIDELADLMMTSGRAIEEPITRLAQKARAVGIHLVVATQRPSVDVITGLIKSNFPARMSFQVSSKIDSRTILDQNGAEKLLGNGDMLFLLPGSVSPVRLHNAYITLDEIESIMESISSQPKPDEIMLPKTKELKSDKAFSVDDDSDELLFDAAKLVIDSQQASVSLLQRKFRIGYSRAGRLIDELESLGIVSGYSGSKARDVLVDHSYLDTIFNAS